MAEAKSEEGGSWWGSFLQSAKEKSSTALEFMKHDLAELSQVVQEDTASAVNSTASLLRDKLNLDDPESFANQAKSGLSSLFTSISDALSPTREPDETELLVIHNSEPLLLDRWEAEVHKIRSNPTTFSHEPQCPPELYEAWLQTFLLEEKQADIALILQTSSDVASFYKKLVPASISHAEFWERYYFRLHQLKQDEIRRAEIIRRAEEQTDQQAWPDDDAVEEQLGAEVVTKEKGDIVVVGQTSSLSLATTPRSSKERVSGSTEDEWEKDFDLELTEEELAQVQNLKDTEAIEKDLEDLLEKDQKDL